MDFHHLFDNFELEDENENLEWLSLLPLFETDHWPVMGWTERTVRTDEYLMHCICDDPEHEVVCVFPYARYGNRSAWYAMEEIMVGLEEHYDHDDVISPGFIREVEDRIIESWPLFYQQIYEQTWDFYGDLWCRENWHGEWTGCPDSPYCYPFWAPDEEEFERCDCSGYRAPLPELQSEPLFVSDLNWGTVQFEWVEPLYTWHEIETREPPVYIELGYYGPQDRRKGVMVSEFNPWIYQVFGESTPSDNPPSYENVSELPPYEHPPAYEE